MIRVGILMFQNMRYAPFLRMYENLLESMNSVEYDVIYYDRDRTLIPVSFMVVLFSSCFLAKLIRKINIGKLILGG